MSMYRTDEGHTMTADVLPMPKRGETPPDNPPTPSLRFPTPRPRPVPKAFAVHLAAFDSPADDEPRAFVATGDEGDDHAWALARCRELSGRVEADVTDIIVTNRLGEIVHREPARAA